MGNGANRTATDRMVLVGLGIGIVYWVIECVLFVFTEGQSRFWAHLFGPDLGGLSTRIVALCLFLIFGSHVQYTADQRRKLEDERDNLASTNEFLRQELEALKKK